MASRNIKPSSVQGFDSHNVNDKMQSSTLKRQPSPDWSKADLLRLLSYFEGELQARDITIATLKAEKAKQLLYQAKYGRFGLGDPFVALQRDAEGKNDTGFDEAAIKSMYDNQLAQLENLIATQRKAQLKMREQLGNSEKRFHKVCIELEEEKQKHAHDTAQGDDVTYMLEKERERLKAEIDFEKSQNKKLEKDLKKTLASLEEERSNAARHKQVAIMLIKERKNLIERIVAENHLRDEMETALTDEKSKIQNMAEGLAQESKKALKMEAVIEKQSTKFDTERETLCLRLQKEESQTNVLKAEVARLSKQLESLQHQVRSNDSSPTSMKVRSSVSPARTANPTLPGPSGATGGVVQPSSGPALQSCVVDSTSLEHSFTTHAVVMPVADSSHALEFLGPEMANLQHLLATMSTGEVSQGCIPVANGNTPSTPQSSVLSSSLTTTSSQMPLSKLTNSPNLQATAHNMPTEEQNNNTVKVSRSSQEIRSTTKATAQVSPFATKSQTTTLRIFDEQLVTTPSLYTTHHIVSPTVVNSPGLTLTPSPKISPTNPSSLINFPPATPSPSQKISPTVKRKNIPSRPRSKSPLKTSHNHSRSYSASARMSTDIHTPVTTQPHSSRWFLSASPIPSLRLSPATEVQGSPLHHNSALGKTEALNKILTEYKGNANLALKDGTTPLHCASENNQEASIKILLQNGAKPSSLRDDQVTPLHIAALKGYSSCVRLLLSKGAAVNLSTTANQTPLHLAVSAGHTECCRLLLRHGANILITGQDGLTCLHYAVQNNHPEMLKTLLDKLRFTGISRESDTAHQIVAVTDQDGWTITHMAAHLPQKECLVMLADNLPLDFEVKDNLGRSVKVVASAICKELLAGVDQPQNSATVKVMVELRNIQENTTVSSVQLGTMEIVPGLSWLMMEDLLQGTLKTYLSQLNIGLKTRRITRLDTDLDRVEKDFTLGLTMANIKHFEIGYYKWTPGMQTNTSPFIMLSKCELKKVTITVNDCDNMCELIAFDVLHPVSNISNYLRLLEQYKSVIFYGPAGSGKSYLAHRLAQSIAAREMSLGRKPAIYQLNLQSGYTSANFLAYLKQRNCVVSISRTNENFAPILLLDNLEMVDIAQLFGELLDPMEYRGIGHTFCLRGEGQGRSGMHYLADQFYVIGTMNKSRSLGVDLSILPRFRWVQFRLDTEPLRGLLARHFFRRIFNTYHGCMPSPEDPVFRAIEWIVCVWQRLNDSLNKLGIPEVIQGPCMFFKCPLEKQDHKLILQWMQNTWNQQIAPRVREAVKRGTGSEAPSDGQQKVANTALYVLMQRSVILSCPLSGQDKDVYFAGFSGSNELDIPLKSGEGKPRGASSTVFSSSSTRNTNQQRRPNSLESAAMQSQKWTSEGDSCNSSILSSSASDFKMRNRNGKDGHSGSAVVALNIKRRSLSDSSVNKAAQQEQQQQYLDGIQASSQAKMAKLEVKYPKIVNIASAFRSPSLSSSETSPSGVPLKKTGCVSPLLTLVADNSHISPKKSRSSENISSSGLYGASGRLRSPGPFPFSLTTPTSSLSFFKFLDKSSSEPMPDFSVFEKVPTPTDDLPLNSSFVFVGRPELKEKAMQDSTGEEKEKEEVWSMRRDLFQPIYRSREEERGGLESET